MNRKGCVPSWLLELALQSLGSRHLTPAAPRPRHCRPGRGVGEKKGQGARRTAGLAGWDEEKGRFVPRKCRGSRMGSPGSSAPLLRRSGWGTAGAGKPLTPAGIGSEAGEPGYPQALPRAPHAAAASRRRGQRCSSSPAPDAHAARNKKSVSGSAAGVGREGGSGMGVLERCKSIKNEMQPGIPFARVRRGAGGGERRSDGSDGWVPAAPRRAWSGAAHSRSRTGCPPGPDGSVLQPRVCRRAGGSASLGRRPIVFGAPFNEVGALAVFGTALSSTASILEGE